MHSRKTVPIPDLMSAANMELIRLDFKSSTLSRHSKEFRSFSNYCRENEITAYDAETGPQYFQHCYGLDIGNSTAKLTKQQLDTRCSIRFLDDIFQFGYALRYGTLLQRHSGGLQAERPAGAGTESGVAALCPGSRAGDRRDQPQG